jgi:hypothetical protein
MITCTSQLWSPSDRRVQARAAFPREAVVCVNNGMWRVPLRDISLRGLGVLLPRELAPASRLVVELFNKAGHFWHRKSLDVVHSTRSDHGMWLVGSIFRQEFSVEELRALLG